MFGKKICLFLQLLMPGNEGWVGFHLTLQLVVGTWIDSLCSGYKGLPKLF